MTEIIFVVEEAPEGGYSARAIGESIFTQADTAAELSRACTRRRAVRFRPRDGTQVDQTPLHER